MLLTCVRMEGRKLRHSWLWLVFMVIPVIPAVMGGGNYMMNQEALQAVSRPLLLLYLEGGAFES